MNNMKIYIFREEEGEKCKIWRNL